MNACPAMQPSLLDRAAGLLPAAAGRELDEHLASCAACRAEAGALDETLGLIRLPPPGADELRALEGLGPDLLRARQAGRARAATWQRLAAGAAVAAAVLAALALPAFWRPTPQVGEAELLAARAAAEAAAWAPPDPDELLAVAELVWPASDPAGPDLGVGGSARAAMGVEDVLLGAAEEWSELFPAAE